MEKVFETLQERGYVYQATDENKIKELLNGKPQKFYFGIDPTADSLHIGHFFALTMVRRLQKLGHQPIILIGGATALVGDPTFKKEMRTLLSREQVEYNKKEVRQLVERFVKMDGENPAIMVDNADWFKNENYVEFMLNIGVHFNVNKMLATDCYRNRLEEGGLTFLEMGYMLMQAYDFFYLNREEGCLLQVGGSDQWANIVAGVDLIRKLDNVTGKKDNEVFGLTNPLLVKADGEKMGKTAAGTLWVSREKTTVYDFYQMFINSYDEDVERLLAFFSDYSMDDIRKMCSADIINAKKVMAFEVTKLVHGEAEAIKVQTTSEEIFSNKGMSENMPAVDIEAKIFSDGINIIDLLAMSELATSKSEARRLIEQGGVLINQEKVVDVNLIVNETFIKDSAIILQKGKKAFLKVNVK